MEIESPLVGTTPMPRKGNYDWRRGAEMTPATKRDDWLQRAEQRLTPTLLRDVFDTSAPKLEARLLHLAQVERNSSVGFVASEFFRTFPVRSREALAVAAAAAGVAWLHAPTNSRFVGSPPAGDELVTTWHAQVTEALRRALAEPPKVLLDEEKADLSPLPKKSAELHDAWLLRAMNGNAAELGVLLERFAEGPHTEIAERALELFNFRADARIGDAVANFLARAPPTSTAETPAFTIAALLLCVHGNRSHRAAVEQVARQLPSLGWLERALPDLDPPRAAKRAGAAPATERDFLYFIAEAPHDAGRASLFMDWLLERGDPRGRFMALQRAGRELSTLERKKVASLQSTHLRDWLGPLARGVSKERCVFRDGLLRELVFRPARAGEVPLPDEPLLATLESLDLDGAPGAIPELLHAAPFPSLRRLVTTADALKRAPDALLARLTALGVVSTTGLTAASLLAVLRRPLPNVATLELVRDWRDGAAEVAAAGIQHVIVETNRPETWEPLRATVKRLELRRAYASERTPKLG